MMRGMKGKLSGITSSASNVWSVCLVIGIAWLISLDLYSQTLQPQRFERQQKNSDDYYHVISLKEEGLALFRERDKYKGSNRIWELVMLDTALQEKKVIELEIKERYKMIGYEIAPGAIFLLYRTGETNKNDFELIQVKLPGDETSRYTIKPDLDFKLTHFTKAGDSFALKLCRASFRKIPSW
jgi:hypothetical protein